MKTTKKSPKLCLPNGMEMSRAFIMRFSGDYNVLVVSESDVMDMEEVGKLYPKAHAIERVNVKVIHFFE